MDRTSKNIMWLVIGMLIGFILFAPNAEAYKLGTTEVPEVDLRAYDYENEGYNSDDAEFDNMIDSQMDRDREDWGDIDYELEYQSYDD